MESVPRTPWEVATALSLGRGDTRLRIVLPQASRVAPALGNSLAAMLENTPLFARDERVRRFVAAVSEVEEGAWAR
jgi:ABC-type amino acid transport system permease subunit